jgi:hypothetical protein
MVVNGEVVETVDPAPEIVEVFQGSAKQSPVASSVAIEVH